MNEKKEPLVVKYAAELSALDTGENHRLVYIKDYKYKGEQRQKLTEFRKFTGIIFNNMRNDRTSIQILGIKDGQSHLMWQEVPLDAKVAIYEE